MPQAWQEELAWGPSPFLAFISWIQILCKTLHHTLWWGCCSNEQQGLDTIYNLGRLICQQDEFPLQLTKEQSAFSFSYIPTFLTQASM